MNKIIINIVLLIVMILLTAFFVALLFLPNIGWWGYLLIGINIILMIFYPIRLCALETILEYKYYRSKRPIKILNKVIKSLKKNPIEKLS